MARMAQHSRYLVGYLRTCLVRAARPLTYYLHRYLFRLCSVCSCRWAFNAEGSGRWNRHRLYKFRLNLLSLMEELNDLSNIT